MLKKYTKELILIVIRIWIFEIDTWLPFKVNDTFIFNIQYALKKKSGGVFIQIKKMKKNAMLNMYVLCVLSTAIVFAIVFWVMYQIQ